MHCAQRTNDMPSGTRAKPCIRTNAAQTLDMDGIGSPRRGRVGGQGDSQVARLT
jgi:hypothetical protein